MTIQAYNNRCVLVSFSFTSNSISVARTDRAGEKDRHRVRQRDRGRGRMKLTHPSEQRFLKPLGEPECRTNTTHYTPQYYFVLDAKRTAFVTAITATCTGQQQLFSHCCFFVVVVVVVIIFSLFILFFYFLLLLLILLLISFGSSCFSFCFAHANYVWKIFQTHQLIIPVQCEVICIGQRRETAKQA